MFVNMPIYYDAQMNDFKSHKFILVITFDRVYSIYLAFRRLMFL